LGAQRQVCGGGSYELSSLFGGPRVPSTGFAIGFDRVCEVCKVEPLKKTLVAVVSFKGLEKYAFKIANELRNRGISVFVDVMGRNLKKQLSFASEINADYAIIIGPDEVKRGLLTVKDMKMMKQTTLKEEDAFRKLGLPSLPPE